MKSTAVASLVVVVAMVTCAGGQMTEPPCIPCTPQRCASAEKYVDCGAFPPIELPCNGYLRGSVCVETAPSCVPCVPRPACREPGMFCCSADCNCYYECGPNLDPKIMFCNPGLEFNVEDKMCKDPRLSTSTTVAPPTPPAQLPCSQVKRGKVPDPSSCHRYIKCKKYPLRGLLHEIKTCPFNMVFDEALLICKPDTDCGSRPRN